MKCVSTFLGKEVLNPSLALVETANSNLFNQWLRENRPGKLVYSYKSQSTKLLEQKYRLS